MAYLQAIAIPIFDFVGDYLAVAHIRHTLVTHETTGVVRDVCVGALDSILFVREMFFHPCKECLVVIVEFELFSRRLWASKLPEVDINDIIMCEAPGKCGFGEAWFSRKWHLSYIEQTIYSVIF